MGNVASCHNAWCAEIYAHTSSSCVQHGSKPGPEPYLSNEEEVEISTFLQKCSIMGYGKTTLDVLNIAES